MLKRRIATTKNGVVGVQGKKARGLGRWISFIAVFGLVQLSYAQTRIMPLGDSITRGVTGSTDNAGYRNDLATLLNNEGVSFDFVGSLQDPTDGSFADPDHEGHDGKTADFILQNINTYLSSANPDIVLLHIGTNDISGDETPESTRDDISSILDEIRNYDSTIQVVLSSLIPRTDAKDSETTTLNNLLEELYVTKRSSGHNIFYAGNNEVFKSNATWDTDYMADAVHPNDTGYGEMAGVFFNAIMNALTNTDITVTDNFERSSIGNTWDADPEFTLQGGDLVNTATTGTGNWEYLATFKAQRNPNRVSIRWSSTADASGIGEGGLALRLDSPSRNASGYLAWITTSDNTLRLWTIANGSADTDLNLDLASQTSAPGPGDVLRVDLSSDANGHHFEFYVNDVFAGKITDANKTQGNGSELYAGVLLRHDRNNNVAEFSVQKSSDTTAPDAITDLTAGTPTATSVPLSWTATGDDGGSGSASSYDLRYSNSPIDESNFDSATQASGLPTPAAAGGSESYVVTGLSSGATYYFAIKAIDEAGNVSPISNVVSATTDIAATYVDDFNRTDLGTNWNADPAFQIVSNELANTSTDGNTWRLAVLNARKNPVEVSYKWGAGADATGIDQGGIAVMLDSDGPTASGYLVTRRTAVEELRLWTITNGVIDVPPIVIDDAPNLPAPGPGDEFKVILASDDSGHHFDVYVNGQFDSRLSDTQKLKGNAADLYSGVMLNGNLNNNIDDFTVLTTIGAPSQLTIVGGDAQTDTVGQLLPEPLTVRLTDDSGNPVEGMTINFVVTSNNGSVDVPPPSENIVIEAESATLTSPMRISSDAAASNEQFIHVPEAGGADNAKGQAKITFNVSQTGDYVLWGRVIAPTTESDSYFIQMDGGAEITWDVLQNSPSSTWVWDAVADRGSGSPSNPQTDPVIFSLSEGIHTLVIKGREDGTQLDQILLTRDLNYVPSGIEEGGGTRTDANGEASANMTLGTAAGTNTVEATYNGLPPAVFTETGIADSAKTILKISGDGQSAPPGQALANPFVAELRDKYDNPVANHEISFNVIAGNGSLNPPSPLTTDQAGQASTTLTLATDTGVNEVEVTFPGYTGEQVIFTATAEPGDPDKLVKYSPDSGDNQTGTAGKPLPKPFKAQVTDVIGSPVAGVNVTFTVTGGGGSFGGSASVVVATDSSGVAEATLTLGPTAAATNTAEASASFNGNPLNGSPLTFSATAAAPQQLVRVSADTLSGTVNTPLSETVKVKVLDALGAALANYSVTFTVVEGGGKLNGSTEPQTVQTDANGIAEVEWTLGGTAGDFTNRLRASATFNGTELDGSPIEFVASAAPGAAVNLVKVSGDSLTGVIQNPLSQPFVVQVNDGTNPVEGWPVTFTVIQGGGSINGSTSKTLLTNASGEASVTLTLGSSSGQWNNVVEATAENGGNPLNGSPVRFVASAAASNARNLILVQGQNQSGQAGEPLPQAIEVKVTDEQQNPIQDHPVIFTVIEGGGTIGTGGGGTNVAAANDTTLVVATDPNGVAAVIWSLGGAIGDSAQVLEARANDGVNELNNSPLLFYATASAGPVDPDASTIVATSPVPADGVTKSEITVTLTDAFGNPIPGKAVFLRVSDPDDVPEQPLDPTDENGQVTGFLKTTRAGWKTISARNINDGMDLNAVALVHFTPLEPVAMALSAGNNQSGNVGTTLPQPLEVLVIDRFGNPTPNGEITFSVTEGGGYLLESQPVLSDTNGIARVHWVLGQLPGTNTVRAEAALTGSPLTFTATGVEAVARRIEMVSGSGQTGPAGLPLPLPVVVKVTDSSGQPVWNHPVAFVIIFDGQQTTEDTIAVVNTDFQGKASVSWTLGPTVGLNFLEARAPGLTGSPVTFQAESFAGGAFEMRAVGGTRRDATVGNWSGGLRVRILDQVGNPVQGTEVLFRILQGSDASLSKTSDVSDESGYARTELKLGTATGEYLVEARVELLYGSPVVFRINGVAAAAKVMSILSGNDQTGTVNRPLPLPLEVLVVDVYDNPKPNVPMNFVVSKGGGSLAESQPVKTNALGIARVTWTIGPGTNANDNEVTVINNDIPGSPLVFRATGVSNNNYPQFDSMPLSYTIRELEHLQFQVSATDDDGDPLTYSAPEKPDGSSFGTSGGAQTFSWTPTYTQAGLHQLVLRVEDNRGGFDQATVQITVENVNRPPSVEPHPAQLDTNITVSSSQRYWIDAVDPDGDPIYFLWMDSAFGPDRIVSSTNEYVLEADDLGFHEITALVYDLDDTVRVVWRTNVKTGVQLAGFSASAAEFDGIRLEWKTSNERENVGFNVLRARSKSGDYAMLNDELIRSRDDGEYFFVDRQAKVGVRYYYMIEDVDVRGTATRHGPVSAVIQPPDDFALSQNYPNPFNPETSIRYQLPKASTVTLKIYNLLGQEVRTLVDAPQEAGYHTVRWDGRDNHGLQVGSGVYYYRVVAGEFTAAKKMVLIR